MKPWSVIRARAIALSQETVRVSSGLAPFWLWLGQADPHLGCTGYSAIIADGLCRSQRRPEAMQMLRSNLMTLLHGSRAFVLRPAPRPPDRTPEMAACLRALCETLTPLGLQPFLAFGTLLGYVREKNFIPGDIDIGLVYEESAFAGIAPALEAAGFVITKCTGSAWPCRIKCVDRNDIPVDLVFFKRDGQYFLTYAEAIDANIVRRRTGFELRQTEFHGVQVWIPEVPEVFLDENYMNDWRVPQPISHYILTSPLSDYGLETVQYHALRHVYRLLGLRQWDHVAFYLDLFVQRSPNDPFWREARRLFQSRLVQA